MKTNTERGQIFQRLLAKDDSNLWPICNKFNVTKRAINRLYRFEKNWGEKLDGLELELWLENEISIIVNETV